MSRNAVRGFFLILAIVVVCIHIYAWLTPNDIFYANMPVFDKIEHFLSGIVLAGLTSTFVKKPSMTILMVVVLVLGIVWELVETTMGYDVSSDIIGDLILNELGALIVALFVAKP